MELSDDLYAQITALSEEGDQLFDQCDYQSAIERFQEAYESLPEPKRNWEASEWLLASIGDCLFQQGKYRDAYNYFNEALKGEAELDNPFIWLRRGQCLYEIGGPQQEALDDLISAYMLAGKEIFDQDDVKYYDFLKAHAAVEE